MSSKTSSPSDDTPFPRLFDALVSHEYNDVTGTVQINVTDALMAIATAINRLAAIQERDEEQRAAQALLAEAVRQHREGDGPGHA
jgi:hypothetical protein